MVGTAVADERFIGTWRYESGRFTGEDGSSTDPYGDGATGLVVYDAAGHMTVQLMRGDRPRLGDDDVHRVDPTRVVASFAGLTTYFGTYRVDPDAALVVHEVEAASHPDWVGRFLSRRYEFEGDRLILTTQPFVVGAETVTGRLVWRRVG